MTDLNANYTVAQWGRKYPNGDTSWQTAEDWVPAWSTKEGRDQERANYSASLDRLGIPTEGRGNLVFLRRDKVVTYSEPTVVNDGMVD